MNPKLDKIATAIEESLLVQLKAKDKCPAAVLQAARQYLKDCNYVDNRSKDLVPEVAEAVAAAEGKPEKPGPQNYPFGVVS